jgi:ATP-dependent Zn protease
VHEAGHAIIAWASGRVQQVEEASLGRFFGNGGWVKYSFSVPYQLFSETDYLSEITVSLAGSVADQLMNMDSRWFLSARADWRMAVQEAEKLVHYRCRHQKRPRPRRNHRWRGRRLSSEALEIVARCHRNAEDYLSRNRGMLIKLSRALLSENQLDTDQLADVLGPKIPPDRSA